MTSPRQKVMCVFGTRPEAIKMAPVVDALQKRRELDVSVCVTGQHREMLDQMLDLFEIEPDYDLDLMRANQTLTGITTGVLNGLEPILRKERPDWLVVQGDTTTTYAAALAAFYAGIRVAHVEAGLRSGSLAEPLPEEMNRRATDAISTVLFAPTEWAAENLAAEGVAPEQIVVSGNTVVDAFRRVSAMPFDVEQSVLADLPLDERRLVLVTVHRRENHGRAVREICAGLRSIATNCDHVHLVIPVHLNPNVRDVVESTLQGVRNVSLVPPLDYPALTWLLPRCEFVITDSGGLQEEAVGLGKHVLVLRERTERVEGVRIGLARLVGSDRSELSWWAARLLYASDTLDPPEANPYGDGRASIRIAERLALGPQPDLADDLVSRVSPEAAHAVA